MIRKIEIFTFVTQNSVQSNLSVFLGVIRPRNQFSRYQKLWLFYWLVQTWKFKTCAFRTGMSLMVSAIGANWLSDSCWGILGAWHECNNIFHPNTKNIPLQFFPYRKIILYFYFCSNQSMKLTKVWIYYQCCNVSVSYLYSWTEKMSVKVFGFANDLNNSPSF